MVHVTTDAKYYVYGYYDPRSYRLFYVGKGRGPRKYSHLKSGTGQKKRMIAAIRKAGLKPLVKVIATGLTEREALIVEAALIWVLQPQLTNEISGSMSECVRPPESLHQDLPGFDTETAAHFVNVGEGPTRSWEDCRKYSFLAAGGGRKWSDQLSRLPVGEIVVRYVKKRGYVGVGRVESAVMPVSDFRYKGCALLASMLTQPGLLRHAADAARSEYVVPIEWIRAVPAAEAQFRRRAGLFTTQLVVAALSRQPRTLRFVEDAFGVSISELASAP
ncbi:GIY-YIG nuclease family protein [Candidatus Methylomirabilis sp.]|uniref:GIY-YIG nuclease family protein n=1 Tax=Candidatus Methylomirabilis sp. TaxID=2032687 RepID=UPI0030760EBA